MINTAITKISAVPTNIITGFLGAGKTSLILYLLKHKPAGERWAVLVNEFGEIGVDGSLFAGQKGNDQNVFIREVPGGCMCCAAGLPMHIALNQLLARAQPDRLLIEPTGLGHPQEIIDVLSAEHYREVLCLGPTLTLVDARNLADNRYRAHDTFNQQIDIADCIVGSKCDLYAAADRDALLRYVNERKGACKVVFAENGVIDPALLTTNDLSVVSGCKAEVNVGYLYSKVDEAPQKPKLSIMPFSDRKAAQDKPLPDTGYLKRVNRGEGFASVGWRFAPDKQFDRRRFVAWLHRLQVQRVKAVVITSEGVFGYNGAADTIAETELDDCLESRIEIIALAVDEAAQPEIEEQLLECLVNDHK